MAPVETFTDADAYAAATGACALVDRSDAGKLLLTGDEAAAFLDAQVSNQVTDLAPGTGRYAALLTNKGKMLGDLRILHTQTDPPGLLLLTERVALQALFDHVRRGLIGWDAELHKRTLELGLLSLIGPGSDTVAAAAGLPVPGGEEHGVIGIVARTDVGLDVLPAAAEVDAVRNRLMAAGARPIAEAIAEVVRVERGRPRYGVDLDASVMPEEAGIVDRAVSFTKGCYVGQETVARLHWRGKPNRHLRGLTLDGPAASGDALRAGDREVGQVRSTVDSPRLGPIALAFVRREVEPGAAVEVGDAGTTATVVALPFS
jgi:folate-binding protein YgfZ